MSNIKAFEELTIQDDYMFCTLMKNPMICKGVLERILNFEITNIEIPDSQISIINDYGSKSIRLDIYVKNADGTEVYNVEMQVAPKQNLPKRTRYYQSSIDMKLLNSGADYRELKQSYVIFICCFDPFEKGRTLYTFMEMCKELPGFPLGDGTAKLFVNADGPRTEVDPELAALLDYIKSGTVTDEFTKEIADAMATIKRSEERRIEYMMLALLLQEHREAGRMEGLFEAVAFGGCAVAFAASALDMSENEFLAKMQEAGYELPQQCNKEK